MGRAPCCEKIGLRKGPWSPEEDHILISHILEHGHANWRALPKQAGLLRCGKSCRLRWTNYLRPDIKRGNLSKEEEETIINLHQMLGNRWSAIAARLPGRTDNEIKNVWHTHLKKKLKDSNINATISNPICDRKVFQNSNSSAWEQIATCPRLQDPSLSENSNTCTSEFKSPQQCSNDMSYGSGTDSLVEKMVIKKEEMDYSSKYFSQINERFWFELSTEDISSEMGKFELQVPLIMNSVKMDSEIDDGMDFWYNLFIRAGEMADLLEFF